jgi:hypothetical protein
VSAPLGDVAIPPASARLASRQGLRRGWRFALTLIAALLLALAIVAGIWWSTYQPVSSALAFGGEGPGRVVIGLRTKNSGHFNVRVTGVASQDAVPGVRLRSIRTRATPAARAVPAFEPFTLKPGQHLYLVLEFAIACGQIPPDESSFGSVDIHYETLWIGRTKHVASLSGRPELTPALACG